MIPFSKYILLTQRQQAEILWLNGVYLELCRQSKSQDMELYGLFDFYVELIFDRVSGDPVHIKPFKETEELGPYLDLINIEDAIEI